MLLLYFNLKLKRSLRDVAGSSGELSLANSWIDFVYVYLYLISGRYLISIYQAVVRKLSAAEH